MSTSRKMLAVLLVAIASLCLVACEGEKNKAEGGEQKKAEPAEGAGTEVDPEAGAVGDEAVGDEAADDEAADDEAAAAAPAVDLSGLKPARNAEGVWGYYEGDDTSGKPAVLIKADNIGEVTKAKPFEGDRAFVQVKLAEGEVGQGWTMIDENGVPLLQGAPLITAARPAAGGKAFCTFEHQGTADTKDDAEGLIGHDGKRLSEAKWGLIACPAQEDARFVPVKVKDGNVWGWLDLQGKEVLAPEYTQIGKLQPDANAVFVQKDAKIGLYFVNSGKLIEATHDDCVEKPGEESCTTGGTTTKYDTEGNPIGG